MQIIKIGIFGGGISGMTVAHELINFTSDIIRFDVTIYESNENIGGLARTQRLKDDHYMPTETSWRGIGPFYYNFFKLLKKIPGPVENKSVYDTELSEKIQFILPLNNKSQENDKKNIDDAYNWFNRFTFMDKFYLGYSMLKYISSSDRRKDYENINVCEMMKSNMSSLGYETARSLLGPFAGLDPQTASFSHIAHFFEMQFIERFFPSAFGRAEWAVFKRPTSEAWLNPWKKHLQNLGVKFKLKHKLIKINFNDDLPIISNVYISNDNNNTMIKKSFDYYVMALNPFVMEHIISKSKILRNEPELKLFKSLTADGHHNQVSFIIGFEDKIQWTGIRTCIVLPESAFNISLYRQDELFHSDINLGDNIKSLWSGTSCIGYQPGIVFNKIVSECTKEEFFEEIVAQLYQSLQFNCMIKIANNGRDFKTFPIKKITTWDNWKFKYEPKWLTTIQNTTSRPSQKTSINNLILSGAHTKTTMDLYSMESAVESGIHSTNVILDYNFLNKIEVDLHLPPKELKCLQEFDNLLYKYHLPNIINVILILLILVVVIILIWIIKKRNT